MTETDLTPRQAIYGYLGGEAVPPHVLRAAVAQLLHAYEEITDLASDACNDPEDTTAVGLLASEILAQQLLLDEYLVFTAAATALPDLVRSRQPSRRTRA